MKKCLLQVQNSLILTQKSNLKDTEEIDMTGMTKKDKENAIKDKSIWGMDKRNSKKKK